MGLGKKVFVRKNGTQKGGRLYKWSPDTSEKKSKNVQGGTSKYFCVAALGTQGNDYKVTYTYVIVVNDKGIAERHAYAQCDYVA